jgi:thioredoxin reductase (NADPH)
MHTGDFAVRAGKPVVMAVLDAGWELERIKEHLSRYAEDYQVICMSSPGEALELLRSLCRAQEEVALVLADQWMTETTGAEFLEETRHLRPTAKRGMLISWGGWGDKATADAVRLAIARGRIDYYVLKPWRLPDEFFHRTITEFLHEWSRAAASSPQEVYVIGERWSQRAHELRSVLGRCGIPHAFLETDGERAQRYLAEAGAEASGLPIVIMLGGEPLVDPTDAELADAFGLRTRLERDEFDLAIVGAGPAGLAAAVYGGSEGLRTLVVEAEALGGQAGASSLIRNYLGFSRGISGSDLATRAYQQAWVFGVDFLLMQRAVGLAGGPQGWELTFSNGSRATARVVMLAVGVSYRRLGIPALEELVGAGVYYGSASAEAPGVAGERVVVVGGANAAGQAALHLARYASQVSMVVRGDNLRLSMSEYLQEHIRETPNVDVQLSTCVVDGGGDQRLERLVLEDLTTGERRTEEAAGLFAMIGAKPSTDWLPDEVVRDEWGFLLTGADVVATAGDTWPLTRPPLLFETSAPGIFAVGDVRHGSVKRVASAAGEGSVALSQVHEYLEAPAEPAGGRFSRSS